MKCNVQRALDLEQQYIALTRKLAACPVSPTLALLLLRIEGEMPLSTVGRGPNFSYKIKILIDGHFIKRRTDVRDRRSAHISLTAKGRAARDAAVKALEGDEEPVMELAIAHASA